MTDAVRHALFDTPLGPSAIAWSDAGILALCLPERDAAAALAAIRRRAPGSTAAVPTGAAAAAVDGVRALLSGEQPDLLDVALDWRGVSDFERRVYDHVRLIPPGRTETYGTVAAAVGEPGAARAVGMALGRNPFAPVVPCHRVLAADGRTGGFSAPGGVATKMRMLAIEGAVPPGPDSLFDHFGVAAPISPRR
jgi:methylated-DNA-[protein]-cysteine S-methyltransferase